MRQAKKVSNIAKESYLQIVITKKVLWNKGNSNNALILKSQYWRKREDYVLPIHAICATEWLVTYKLLKYNNA